MGWWHYCRPPGQWSLLQNTACCRISIYFPKYRILRRGPSPYYSISGYKCVFSCGKTNSGVGGIKYRVETLKESEAINEVEALATGRAQVADNEVDGVTSATNTEVEVTRPDLAVGDEFIDLLCSQNDEH